MKRTNLLRAICQYLVLGLAFSGALYATKGIAHGISVTETAAIGFGFISAVYLGNYLIRYFRNR